MLIIDRFCLFPFACVCCYKASDGGVFCHNCFSNITVIEKPYCQKCGKMFLSGISNSTLCTTCFQNEHVFDFSRALFLYDFNIRQLIVCIKQTGSRSIIKKLCKMIFVKYESLFTNTDAIIPVPSHWSRTLFRGFNPADVIAWELHKLSGIDINRKLKRTHRTKYQHKKSRTERIKNVQNAFSWNDGKLGNLDNVVLVDDVMTTGATLNECAKVLRNAGIQSVRCVTIASTKAQ